MQYCASRALHPFCIVCLVSVCHRSKLVLFQRRMHFVPRKAEDAQLSDRCKATSHALIWTTIPLPNIDTLSDGRHYAVAIYTDAIASRSWIQAQQSSAILPSLTGITTLPTKQHGLSYTAIRTSISRRQSQSWAHTAADQRMQE